MLVSPEEVRATLTALLPEHLRDAPTVPAYSRRIEVAGTTISRALTHGIDRRHLDRWVRRASAIAPEPPPVPASKAGLVLTAEELAGASLAVLARRHGVGIAVIRGLRKQLGVKATRGRKPGYEISPRAPGPAPKALARAIKSYNRSFDALTLAELHVEKARAALARAEAVAARRRERLGAAGARVKELEGRRS